VKAKLQDVARVRWDDVQLFLAAHRHGTLGAAAARLGVDVSTMSRRLTALERALGVRLFDRTRQGLAPTRASAVVLPAAEAMETALGRLARDVSGLEADAVGVVRLSVAPGMSDAFVAPLLPGLREKHPQIRLEIDASTRAVDIARHEADLALRSVRLEGAELLVTKLMTARWVAMASPPLAQELGRLRSWDAAPWIAWDSDMASMPAARWLARHGSRAEIALRTSHFATQLSAAEAGLALMLAPEPYARVRELVPVRTAESLAAAVKEWPSDDLWLVGHRALRDVPRVSAVWSYLVEALRGLEKGARRR
jgi:DNA-binding transcriptional LysR family regulator